MQDTRRDKLFALRMQIAITKRDRDETRGRHFPDQTEVAEQQAKVRELEDRYHRESWRGAP